MWQSIYLNRWSLVLVQSGVVSKLFLMDCHLCSLVEIFKNLPPPPPHRINFHDITVGLMFSKFSIKQVLEKVALSLVAMSMQMSAVYKISEHISLRHDQGCFQFFIITDVISNPSPFFQAYHASCPFSSQYRTHLTFPSFWQLSYAFTSCTIATLSW